MSGRNVLVVGGTGPSGPPIVNNFLRDGDTVAIYHSGAHEAAFEGDVEHIHGDPRDPSDIEARLGSREWDVAVCTSGRLRALATTLAGRTRRLVGITGQPVYLGAVRPTPAGRIAIPVPEDAPRQYDATDYTGKVAAGEDQLFEQDGRGDFEAVVVRYPGVFGPRCALAHEWAVVKRIVDGRPHMALAHDGLACFQRGYTENLGHLVYLAGTHPDAAGHAFNSGDSRVMTAAAVAEAIIDELGAKLELVGMPAQFCRGSYPLAEKSNLVLDLSKARDVLGYEDRVDVEEATRRTARWLFENREFGATVNPNFGGRLPYVDEDRVIGAWRQAAAAVETSSRQA